MADPQRPTLLSLDEVLQRLLAVAHDRVLPEVESSEVPVFLAYPEELRHSKRVAAFREFVSEEIFKYRKREQG